MSRAKNRFRWNPWNINALINEQAQDVGEKKGVENIN